MERDEFAGMTIPQLVAEYRVAQEALRGLRKHRSPPRDKARMRRFCRLLALAKRRVERVGKAIDTPRTVNAGGG